MKPSYFLVALLLAATGWGALAQAPKPPASGKPMVLLLDNFQVVDGTVERVGDAYRLRRGKDVKDYPSKQVLFAGESREEVYKLMMARGLKPPAPPPMATVYNSAALRAFPVKVQPVVMNLCADCHAKPDHPSEFQLARVPAGYANPEASHRNAKEVAKFVNRDDPSASLLLVKAVTAHGGQRVPAFYNQTHPAYRNLELWAHWAVGPEGSPMPEAAPMKKTTRAERLEVARALKPTERIWPLDLKNPTAGLIVPVGSSEKLPREALELLHDPYDPSVFNQAMHSGK